MTSSRRCWHVPDRDITPEDAWVDRRRMLKSLVAAGLLPAAGLLSSSSLAARSLVGQGGGREKEQKKVRLFRAPDGTYPAKRNARYKVERAITDETSATAYNNFYEFSTNKEAVRKLVGRFETAPWKIEIAGLVEKPGIVDLEDLFKHLPSEERVYRFRCVEAWAMTVPWTGFPMRKLIEWVKPKPAARFVRMVTHFDPKQMPGRGYKFPYYEALTLKEAAHELTLLAYGLYGKDMPRQNGAPLRLVVPWKYGLKNIKSIVKLEFTKARPKTFWNDLQPREYSWHSNVEPHVPHPRWSQATERLIPGAKRVKTLPYNGYADLVADLYA